jgi:hypothetical protein
MEGYVMSNGQYFHLNNLTGVRLKNRDYSGVNINGKVLLSGFDPVQEQECFSSLSDPDILWNLTQTYIHSVMGFIFIRQREAETHLH